MLTLLLASAEGLLLAPTAPRCRPVRMAGMMAPADTSLIQIEADADAVGKAVLAKVDLAAAKAISERGHFALAIPGGSVLKMLKGSRPAWADKCTLAYVNHKAVAMDECLTTPIPTLQNWANLLTKVLYGNKRRNLVNGLLYDIYEYDLN